MSLDLDDKHFERELGHERNSAVVGILDMDAFEVQIYLKKSGGNWKDIYYKRPCVLADFSTERLISVNYPAKTYGISRNDTETSAMKKCPNVYILKKDPQIIFNPQTKQNQRLNKPETFNLRHSSWAVLDSILRYRQETNCQIVIEYATNDEFYIDVTEEVSKRMKNLQRYPITLQKLGPNTHLEGKSKFKGKSIVYRANTIYQNDIPKYWGETRLVMGAVLLEEIRQYILFKTGFEASAGVACNKLLAKLACPLHKPGGTTILPETGLQRISGRIPIDKIPTLGGDRGKILRNTLNNGHPMSMRSLADFSVRELTNRTGLGGIAVTSIFKLANGISSDKVVEKTMKESLSVGKSNLRSLALFFSKTQEVESVFSDLLMELVERLKEELKRHSRVAEVVRVEISGFIKGNKGRRPAVKGFSMEVPRLPERLSIPNMLAVVMNWYNETCGKTVGMIVKINVFVKNFEPL